MRALLQRVTSASVDVANERVGAIGPGFLALVGVHQDDVSDDVAWLAQKILGLRVFPDDAGKMNRSVVDAGGSVLLVSQFTLHGDTRKGRRPSFEAAARPDRAVPLLDALERSLVEGGVRVSTGTFGAHMVVSLVNDGPVTLLLDSNDRARAAAPPDAIPRGRFQLLEESSALRNASLVLASSSPRRRDLLRDLGLSFRMQAVDVDERSDVPADPDEAACVLAERKARAAATLFRESLVLAADTIVVVEDTMLGKPEDEDEAVRMLRALAGREHRVVTGVCVAHPRRDVFRTRCVSTTVRFRPVGDGEIRRYVATGEPFGKAGAYAIQGLGALLVAGIEGDYSNVVGLPLGATLDLLEEVLTVFPPAAVSPNVKS
jgi:MAF protein/D-tyrosyl-tRNA(Tyr) deacylase